MQKYILFCKEIQINIFFATRPARESESRCSIIASLYFVVKLTSLLPKLASKRKYKKMSILSGDNYSIKVTPIASPAQSKLSQPSGCAGMCGIYYLLLWGALNDCWRKHGAPPSSMESLSTNQDSAAFFLFQALCSAKVKKRLYPLPLHTLCQPPLLIHTLTQAGKHTHTPAARRWGSRAGGTSERHCWKLMASPKQAQRPGMHRERERMKESYQRQQLDWLWQGTDGIERLHQYRKLCHQQFCAFR